MRPDPGTVSAVKCTCSKTVFVSKNHHASSDGFLPAIAAPALGTSLPTDESAFFGFCSSM